MFRERLRWLVACLLPALALAGCTVHPAGESDERRAAELSGRPYLRNAKSPQPQPLSATPSPEELVRYALATNGDVEQRYWEWRATIEQIPQDGTQPTNLALFGNLGITRGSTAPDKAALALGNDPMADILLPAKLSIAARRALENARAAGFRFRKASWALRSKVLNAYADYALSAELIRLEQSNADILQTTLMVVEARNGAGAGGQQELLKARNELDIARNDATTLTAQLSAQRAALNSLLDRAVDARISLPAAMPTGRAVLLDSAQILSLAAARNPELAALAHDIAARRQSIQAVKLQYLPDLSLSAGTDLAGVTQSLAGMVTIPLLRYQAIDAAVAQAEANLRASEAMRRQMHADLGAQLVMDLTTIRDSDRQLALFEHTVLPRARQVVTVGRSAYEAGQSSLLDLLDAQRSLIALQRLVAHLRTAREQRLNDLEAIIAIRLESSPSSQDVAE